MGTIGIFARQAEDLVFEFRKGFIHRDEGDEKDGRVRAEAQRR